jgi:hypothetical protein
MPSGMTNPSIVVSDATSRPVVMARLSPIFMLEQNKNNPAEGL